MAEFKTAYSPLHIDCEIGQPYGNVDPDYSCGFHTGVDFPQSGTDALNPELYSVSPDGIVVYVYKNATGNGGSPSLGNQVQIRDERTGLYYRYCHMLYGSINVEVGQHVDTSTVLGRMGNTGNSFGTHLHLEATKAQAWVCSNFVDPCAPLGFPNIRGTKVIFDGTVNPPLPAGKIKKHKFSWAIRNAIKRRKMLTNRF